MEEKRTYEVRFIVEAADETEAVQAARLAGSAMVTSPDFHGAENIVEVPLLQVFIYTRYLRAYRPAVLTVLAYSRSEADDMARDTGHDVAHFQVIEERPLVAGVLTDG